MATAREMSAAFGKEQAAADARFRRLMDFLDRDPNNLSLLADAAVAAYDARALAESTGLLARHAALAPLGPGLMNLKGLVALAAGHHGDAVEVFSALRAQGGDDPVLRFNLAWAQAMQGAWAETLALLDEDVLAAIARARSLKIESLHQLSRYEEGLEEGEALAELYPDDAMLMGRIATLAMDAENVALARHYALKAGGDAEGKAALGMLTLGDHDAKAALALFDSALAAEGGNPRAWVGKGLALMITGDAKSGAAALSHGAELFEDHLGSWIAAGWAHFVNGDYVRARACFERSDALDPTFAEGHGGLAVLAIVEGDTATATRECEIALRLNRNCFGAALAKSMLLEKAGQGAAARKIRELALNTPVGADGRTIAQTIAGFAISPKRQN